MCQTRWPLCCKGAGYGYSVNVQNLGINGPEYVTVDSSSGAPTDPLSPEGIFPIIDEFEVTVPTEGFVYDRLNLIDDNGDTV